MVSNPENSSADRDDTPIRGRGGTSPKSVDLPFWVDAFLHLDPPRRPDGKVREAARWRIYPVVRALLADRINVRGDEDVQLNRDKLAKWGGFGHARNCGWLFEYLERIGFLEVQHHPNSSGQGFDTFDVFTEPPKNYVGPTTYAELDMAITAGACYPLLVGNDRNPRSKPNSAHAEVGSNPNSAHAEVGSENPRSKPNSAHAEVGSNPNSAHAEVGSENPRSKPNSAHAEPSRARTPSSPSGRSGRERPEGENETTKPAADAAAGTSHSEEIDWARLLVRALPWSQRMPQGRELRTSEARDLAAVFRRAADVHHYTEQQIQDWALDRLNASNGKNPARWVLNAFSDAALDREPLAESVSLPQDSQTSTTTAMADDEPQGEQLQQPTMSKQEWCGQCGDDPSDSVVARHCRNNPRRRTLPNGDYCPCSGLVADADAA